jgi:hypothetical protein
MLRWKWMMMREKKEVSWEWKKKELRQEIKLEQSNHSREKLIIVYHLVIRGQRGKEINQMVISNSNMPMDSGVLIREEI